MADRPKLICYNCSMKNSAKKEMKTIYFVMGLLLGLALITIGIVKLVTARSMIANLRNEQELESTISSLVEETERLREERGANDAELIAKEAQLSDAEAELLVVRNGGYDGGKPNIWLETLPLFIAGIFAIGVPAVVYKNA